MRKVLVFLLIASTFPFEAIAQKTGFFDENYVDLFNYVSDKCRNMSGPDEAYQIAMSLRDSKNEKEKLDAADCLLVAASWGGNGPAQFELARMYSTGTLFPQNTFLAYRWAQLAYMDGNKDAAFLRDRLEKELTVEEIDAALLSVKTILEEREKAKQDPLTKNISSKNRNNQGTEEAEDGQSTEELQFDPETGRAYRPSNADSPTFSFQQSGTGK